MDNFAKITNILNIGNPWTSAKNKIKKRTQPKWLMALQLTGPIVKPITAE
jgi:hypothetical protein